MAAGGSACLGFLWNSCLPRKVGYRRTVIVQDAILAAAFDFIDANHREMRHIGMLYIAEFMLELLFGGINQKLGMLAKYDFSNLDKARHVRLADFMRIEFINLVVVMKLNAKGRFFCLRHGDKLIRLH